MVCKRVRCVLLPLLLLNGLAAFVLAEQVSSFNGRPAFSEGSDRRYYVWRDGDTWHVRWTTRGKMLPFAGSVVAEGGKLKSVKRIDLEEERRIIAPGRPGRVVVGPRGRSHVEPSRPPVVATREQDKIEKDGDQRIYWKCRTAGDIDGLDFKIDQGVTALRFNLEIDGMSRPEFVEAGASNRRPQQNPFRVEIR